MSAAHDIPELDRKGLREFGLTTGGIVAVLFGLFFPWLLDRPWPVWPWAVLVVLGLWGLMAPESLRPVYTVWMRFGLLLSRITTPIIMGIVFYVVLTPIAVFRRVAGKDFLARQFDDSPSYRVPSRRSAPDNLKRPY